MTESILKQFESVPTTCISDATKGLYNLDSDIKPLHDDYKLVGRAFTVKIPVGDNLAVLKAINGAKKDDVLVIDAKGDTYRAVAGDLYLGMAQKLGIKGVVADGVIRDKAAVRALNFPVFCKGTTVAASNKIGVGELNQPISCGGMPIKPGDIIVGDADGVVVVPQEQEKQILAKALKKLEHDQKLEQEVLGNIESIRTFLHDILK
ncbi:RraA family protein [Virgibacillus sp. MG-45]|uniref:RraA family protein n=1 Tax=Virgibacillus sp. MG-45 TaxID=3102791 RepID=UPI002EDB7DAE